MAGPPEIADPRPRIVTDDAGAARVAGHRCGACGHPIAFAAPACPDCRGELADATFGPGGTVWAHTTLHISVGGRAPGYTLAYVDLDEGPRILAHVDGGRPAVGSRVRVAGTTSEGDPLVTIA